MCCCCLSISCSLPRLAVPPSPEHCGLVPTQNTCKYHYKTLWDLTPQIMLINQIAASLCCFEQKCFTSPCHGHLLRKPLLPLHYISSTRTMFGMELLGSSENASLPGLHMQISYLTSHLFLAQPGNQDAVHKTLYLKIKLLSSDDIVRFCSFHV